MVSNLLTLYERITNASAASQEFSYRRIAQTPKAARLRGHRRSMSSEISPVVKIDGAALSGAAPFAGTPDKAVGGFQVGTGGCHNSRQTVSLDAGSDVSGNQASCWTLVQLPSSSA
jgi:hypothetical protein